MHGWKMDALLSQSPANSVCNALRKVSYFVKVKIIETIFLILKEFLALTISVAPFFLLGVVFAAFLNTYISIGFIGKFLNKGWLSIISATVLGALLPGCSCSTIPIAAGLKKKGAGLGV